MSKSDQALISAVRRLLIELKDVDPQIREDAAKWLKEGLEGKLSEGGQAFVDDLCELLTTGEPNNITKYLGLTS